MHNLPFISIIISTHNRPLLLERCLNSILQQAGSYEIILCSDESSQNTKNIATKMLRASDSFLVTPTLKGPAATRNLGLQISKGQWICFLDDDDTFDANFFHSISHILLNEFQTIHYFNYHKVNQFDDQVNNSQPDEILINLSDSNIHSLLIANFIPNNALMYPSAFAKSSKFDEHLQSHEDWDYLISLYHSFTFKHHNISGPRVHAQSTDSRNNKSISSKFYLLDFIYIYRKWPAHIEAIKILRLDLLKSRGIDIPIDAV